MTTVRLVVKASPTDILRLRLAGQFLTTTGPTRGSDVVSALGAVQSQDYPGAKWALGQRVPGGGATDESIEREIANGSILRTHILRPTWHFVSPADIRWMLALTAPRLKQALAYHARTNELTPAVVRRSHAALTKALAGGTCLTRGELAPILERAGVRNAAGQRLYGLLVRAEVDAIICSGPHRRSENTYALLDERVPPTSAIEHDEALAALTLRYFRTRGPATQRDFTWWSGLSAGDTKRGIQIAEGQLERVTCDGQLLYHVERAVPRAKASAHLLPNYDEYFIGYKDRSTFGARLGHASHIGGDARIANVIFVDGLLVGGWRRVLEPGAVVVQLDLGARLSAGETRRVVLAARKFGAFLGRSPTLLGA
jgi:hypothetical protein